MTAPPFALPATDPRDPPAGALPVVVGARDRARRLAAVGALGAAAMAATLAVLAAVAVFEQDVVEVLARPAAIDEPIVSQGVRDLAGLPGPSPFVVAALLPAVALLLLAALLRRLGAGAPPVHGASPEALEAAERTMGLAVRVIATGAVLVFVVPALLETVGLRTVSLTTGSMAPAHPAGSLLVVTRLADPAALPVGAVVVIEGPPGLRLTHRVVGLVRDEAGAVTGYRTRGDAAGADDPVPAASGSIDGVVVAGIPVVGALRAWMASPLGIAIGLVLAWAFAGLAVLLGDDRRRAVAQAVARSTSRPTS